MNLIVACSSLAFAGLFFDINFKKPFDKTPTFGSIYITATEYHDLRRV